MNKILTKVKNVFNRLFFYLPTPLPIGMNDFDSWAQSIINVYLLPDNDSTRFALATMILHLDSTSSSKPKAYFGRATRKSMSNQIAAGVMQDLKQKQADKIKAEQEAVQKAATAEISGLS